MQELCIPENKIKEYWVWVRMEAKLFVGLKVVGFCKNEFRKWSFNDKREMNELGLLDHERVLGVYESRNTCKCCI